MVSRTILSSLTTGIHPTFLLTLHQFTLGSRMICRFYLQLRSKILAIEANSSISNHAPDTLICRTIFQLWSNFFLISFAFQVTAKPWTLYHLCCCFTALKKKHFGYWPQFANECYQIITIQKSLALLLIKVWIRNLLVILDRIARSTRGKFDSIDYCWF